MKGYRVSQAFITTLVVLGIFQGVSVSQQVIKPEKTGIEKPEKKSLEKPQIMVIDYEQRELQASPAILLELKNFRQEIKAKKLTFQVGYTIAMDFELEEITGLKVPPNLPELIKKQNALVKEFLERRPLLKTEPVDCAKARRFDWREEDGATSVRDQGNCGSCWAFATHGAFEGSFLISNSNDTDTSEQDTLDCSGLGTCRGGWWAHQYLVDKGSATEPNYPYVARRGTCKTGVARPYQAVLGLRGRRYRHSECG